MSFHGVKLPMFPKLSAKRSRSIDWETSFAAYDDKSAEQDIIGISRVLTSGIPARAGAVQEFWHRLRNVEPERIPLKIVFVFDEMDKLDDYQQEPGSAGQEGQGAGGRARARSVRDHDRAEPGTGLQRR